ncbi:MAG: universal stress protein [Bacteroidetes bacterium]|nr:MAG: universal stress protein [Bacteroidota bacterium]
MKTILVPTDFSDHALFALKVAASVAKKINAMINIVHVYNLPSSGFEQNEYSIKFYSEIYTRAEGQIAKLSLLDFLEGIDVKTHIIKDRLMWEIVKDERFKDSDLIVMGSHGESEFSKVFIGSNTEKFVRLADSPVLTIKNEIEDFVVNKMVFTSNFFEESYAVFEKIKFFVDLYNVHIYLLKVITPKEFEPTPVSQKLMDSFIKKFKIKNCSVNIYNSQNIESGIIEFSEEVKADLIAIETHGRTGFAHLIHGSLAEDIVKHEAKPVLSIKIPALSKSALRFMGYRNDYDNWGNE